MATLLVAVVFGFLALGALGLSVSEAPVGQSLITTSTAWSVRDQSSQMAGLAIVQAPSPPLFLTARVRQTPAFIWPAHGDITSYMDGEHPMGIDIGLDSGVSSPIVSTAAGVVDFAGGSLGHAYGYYVRVDHGNGLVTLYAHLSEIHVTAGQPVAQGELLGYGGSSGKATGKHLHFEVRVWDQLADPLELLPELPEEDAFDLDCGSGQLVVMSGEATSLDFSASLPPGTKIAEAAITANGAAANGPAAVVEGAATVLVSSPLRVEGAGSETEESYTLDLIVQGGAGSDERACSLRLAALSSYLIPYSEASYAAAASNSAYEPQAPLPEPTPQPPAIVTEPSPPPTEAAETPTPVATPDGIPLLGDVTTPTPIPSPSATPTPAQTSSSSSHTSSSSGAGTPTETPPAATATPTASPTPETTPADPES